MGQCWKTLGKHSFERLELPMTSVPVALASVHFSWWLIST